MSDTLTHLPVHLAIIMDGNGRWAQARGLPREAGHRAGAETVRTIVTECRRLGIRHLTLYTFSSENWSRPKAEVSALFSLLLEFLGQEVPRMEREGIRLNILGDMEALPLAARTALRHGLRRTAANTDMVLNLALNYGGRAELVRAVRAMMAEGLRPGDVTEQSLADHLYTAGQPDPDFLIRTSGEQRLSNYLLYQCAYSEFYFPPTPWPDFGVEALHEALAAAPSPASFWPPSSSLPWSCGAGCCLPSSCWWRRWACGNSFPCSGATSASPAASAPSPWAGAC